MKCQNIDFTVPLIESFMYFQDLFVLLDLLGTADVKFFNYFEETSPWYMRLVSYERRLREMQLLHARKNYIFQNTDLFHAGIQDDHIPFLKRGELTKSEVTNTCTDMP